MIHKRAYIKLCRAVVLAAAVAGLSCSHHRVIPDDTLAEIFRDAFLTNAYIENRSMVLDSMDIYGPIFASYGYTAEDVRYTIGNFSKRKSARLGNVVEAAIKQLEDEGLRLEYETAILDTVDNIARRTFTRRIYSDSLLHIRSLRDSLPTYITLEDISPGEYRINFDYIVDSADRTTRRGYIWFEREDGTRNNRQQYTLRIGHEKEHLQRVLVTSDTMVRRLVVQLLELPKPSANTKSNAGKTRRKPDQRRVDVTFSDISIVYVPAANIATDSLFMRQMDVRIFSNAFLSMFGPRPAADSLMCDSLMCDSLLRDSLLRDSLLCDSLLRDSLLRDSLLRDSLLPADSLPHTDSLSTRQ